MTASKLIIPASTNLASRRKNSKKNLSLSLSTATTTTKPAFIIPNDQNLNAYPHGPIEILPHLYLGSEQNIRELDHLKLSIKVILNVAAEVNVLQPKVGYHKLNWEHNQDNLVLELQKAVDIIDKARSAGQNILVHCQCGVARSATVIIAYVMKTMKLSMQEAYDYVKNLSPVISPNLGLLFQLREFELMIKKPPIKKIPMHSHFSFKTSSLLWKKRSLFYKRE
ncbi:hypothetical protein G6F16_005822 [Rhizopus arrhizus]|jgi:protein-tyrosine phosphatase|uniref:protein-tyrosine-phosphatase n=1 Tax=Rhizopus oryzae TaxID=64495 RepID=A0A9P7BTY0_RHIOR|nr:hypothetical protein G6F21_000286 [Rhizopus arrhizus]KAG0813811.1 hypothetical protein G6F20_005278 [Rhizopus arrhizus]KAG0838904.1 hypothetical protein G6F19_002881 [Rhizopus arrhizus]KAG0842727.1 hypothetical protein G6F18_002631 [Rhizopus arrhizus]KAG0855424.1 hypothetical protein G6F17_005484 [Rhizopus arrhizus]